LAACTQVAGRHLAFDGRLLHGALHALAFPTLEPYHRVSVLINIWHRHKPLNVSRLPADFATSLSNLLHVQSTVASQLEPRRAAPLDEAALPSAWHPVFAISLDGAADAADAAGDSEPAGDETSEWTSWKVGYIPLHSAVQATPNWQNLPASMGYPFRHLEVRLRHLEQRGRDGGGTLIPFVHLPNVELECDLWTDGARSQRKDWRDTATFLAEIGF
jgi:hypothetical protein